MSYPLTRKQSATLRIRRSTRVQQKEQLMLCLLSTESGCNTRECVLPARAWELLPWGRGGKRTASAGRTTRSFVARKRSSPCRVLQAAARRRAAGSGIWVGGRGPARLWRAADGVCSRLTSIVTHRPGCGAHMCRPAQSLLLLWPGWGTIAPRELHRACSCFPPLRITGFRVAQLAHTHPITHGRRGAPQPPPHPQVPMALHRFSEGPSPSPSAPTMEPVLDVIRPAVWPDARPSFGIHI